MNSMESISYEVINCTDITLYPTYCIFSLTLHPFVLNSINPWFDDVDLYRSCYFRRILSNR